MQEMSSTNESNESILAFNTTTMISLRTSRFCDILVNLGIPSMEEVEELAGCGVIPRMRYAVRYY